MDKNARNFSLLPPAGRDCNADVTSCDGVPERVDQLIKVVEDALGAGQDVTVVDDCSAAERLSWRAR